MKSFAFHSEAEIDLIEILDFLTEAQKPRTHSSTASNWRWKACSDFLIKATGGRLSLHGRCDSNWLENT
jgi:hypothetical protein